MLLVRYKSRFPKTHPGFSVVLRPKKTKKSPVPAFHAASQAERRELRDVYACSWPPTVPPPRSSGPGFATWCSPEGASRRRCRLWTGRAGRSGVFRQGCSQAEDCDSENKAERQSRRYFDRGMAMEHETRPGNQRQ
jgi:hypothetical protein